MSDNLPVETDNQIFTPEYINNIKSMTSQDRNDEILYLYVVKGIQQIDIARHLGVTQPTVSNIIRRAKQDEGYKQRAICAWEKDISVEMRRKASKTVESINPEKIPEGSKATTAAILIDKARLIDGEQDLTQSYQQINADKVQIIQVLQQRGVQFPDTMVD